MRNRSAGYELLRIYVRFAFWLTHKSITVTGQQNIPSGKPIIFAPNHQNALMDPLALVCTNPFQTVWLARADIFKSKTIETILKYLKLLPIYRIRDGKDNLSNNEQIFSIVTELLEKKQSIALFPEAAHSGRRQMLPHKKAIPRIALEAEAANNFKLDLQIIPVGIYYDHYWLFNRTLIVQYGTPIAVDRYQDEYAENPQKAMLMLRDEIHDRLLPLVMEIGSNEYYRQYEAIRQLTGSAFSQNHFFSKKPKLQRFLADQELVKKLEKLEKEQAEAFIQLLNKTSEYFARLSAAKLQDEEIRMAGKSKGLKLIGHLIVVFLLLPVFIAGFVFNALPFYIPRLILRRKVKDLTFLSTFNFVAGLIVFPVSYLFETGLLNHFIRNFYISILIFLILPFAGKISHHLLLYYKKIYSVLKFHSGTRNFRNKLKTLYKQRNELIAFVLQKIENY